MKNSIGLSTLAIMIFQFGIEVNVDKKENKMPISGVASPSKENKYAYLDEYVQIDQYKKMIEQQMQKKEYLKQANSIYTAQTAPYKKGYGTVVRNMSEFSKYKNELLEEIEHRKNLIETANALQERAEQLPFKIGDAIFVKDIGNVIINGITLDDNSEFYYETLGTSGTNFVKAVEALPINETTKVLYGKK